MTEQRTNFIGGVWTASAGDEVQQVINPASGSVIAETSRGAAVDVERAVQAARRAFDTWRDTTPRERSEMLLKLAAAVEDHGSELARIESENAGKPLAPTLSSEIPFVVDCFRFFAGSARMLEGRAATEYMRGHTSFLRREPVGVVASIAPWNYPLMMAAWKIAPALAAGNVVILKPSEWTPLTALRLAELAGEIFPAGVLNVLMGDGDRVGAGLVRHPGVNMVSLTGDVATGKAVARAAADSLKRVHLELGGKAPMIVLDDADLDKVTAAIKVGGYFNAGQDCTATTRVLAAKDVFDDLLSRVVPAVSSIKVADPQDADTQMGPLVSSEHLDRVAGFVDRARASGAEVLTGGTRIDRPGYWYLPSVIVPLSQQDEIVQKEVFGPVVTVQRFSDESEALSWANDVPYGLAASVWTRDSARAMRMVRKLEFGTVWINAHLPLVNEMPHGGFRESGYGKDMSVYSTDEYTRLKHVMASLE